MNALRTHQGVAVVDRPGPFRDNTIRPGLPLLEAGFSDAEVFDAAFTDTDRLTAFRAVCGNRAGPVPAATLFDHPAQPLVDIPTGGRL